MTHELAQKLKDAGFPQGDSYTLVKDKEFSEEELLMIGKALNEGSPMMIPVDDPFIPTLSELIEALGTDFNFVCRNLETGLWGAETHSGVVRSKDSSPEEAVANLWFALNKKDGSTL